MHEIKVVQRKGCGNCESMMPELKELAKEIPIKFIAADTDEGIKEIAKTGLPQVILPLINIDGRDVLMGYHSSPREKILASLVNSPGLSERPEKVIVEKQWQESENVFCTRDIEFNLRTGEKIEKGGKCSQGELE